MKGGGFVYIIGAILALFALQFLVGEFFAVLPDVAYVVGAIVAALCAYGIYTEKDGRRIDSVDRFLGLAAVPVSVARSDARVHADAMVGSGSPKATTTAPDTIEATADEFQSEDTIVSDSDDDLSADDAPPIPPVRRPQPPRPPSRAGYNDAIDKIRKTPPVITPPPVRSPNPDRPAASAANPPRAGVNYETLVAKMQATPAQVISKDDLVTAIAKNVIGQREAIETIATYTRGKLGARDTGRNKPLVFLLPGPTGTGKTEISKAVAIALGTKLVRYDMGEYADEFKASNLFGSPKGYVGSTEGGALPNALRRGDKRMVILFDEVEKADKSIWQKMLAFMDEGRTGDSKGEVVAPKDTIVLLTTNRQAEEIGNDPAHAREILQHDGYFSPEFLGRVEKIVPMPRLTDVDMMQLTHRLADVLAHQYGLSLVIEDDALVALFRSSQDAAKRAGGRGITERLRDLLLEDLIDLQAGGREIGHVSCVDGRVRALPA